jgi:hypothetical protein
LSWRPFGLKPEYRNTDLILAIRNTKPPTYKYWDMRVRVRYLDLFLLEWGRSLFVERVKRVAGAARTAAIVM